MPADAMASRSMFWAARADLRVVARPTGYGGRNMIAGVACPPIRYQALESAAVAMNPSPPVQCITANAILPGRSFDQIVYSGN